MNVPQNDADRRFKCNNRASRHSSWVFDTLEIGKYIDEVIPKTRHHTITHGTGVKALSLNGLGYNEGRLFLMPDFFGGFRITGINEEVTQTLTTAKIIQKS